MEALGAAASVAGLISLAIEIPRLIDAALSIKAAPEEAQQLAKTVNVLVGTLQKLEAFLKSEEARDMKLADDSGLTVSISACQSRILDLSKKLYSHSPKSKSSSTSVSRSFRSTITNFKWPLDKKHCLEVISELHAMQSTFEFCLVLKNCQQMSKCHKDVLSHFKSQRVALEQMGAAFPQQAAMLSEMTKTMETVEVCVAEAVTKLDRIQISLHELESMKRDLVDYHADKLRGQALEWLSALDPSVRQDEVRSARLAGTCEWAVHDPAFQAWVRHEPSIRQHGTLCWVGDPGHGKTFTLSRIVDFLQETHHHTSGIYTTYLYCDYRQTSDYSPIVLYGALARQLMSQINTVPTRLSELLHEACIKLNRSCARLDEIRQVFTLLAPCYNRLFVCIDALDECSVAAKLLDYCREIPGKVSYIFIGRQSISRLVKRAFPNTTLRHIEPQREDVSALINEKIVAERDWQPDLLPEELARDIKMEISKLANGMFLLASLHTQLVLSCNTILKRREALNVLPDTLEATFGQTLARIRETQCAKQAWMVLAYIQVIGPLSMEVIRHALAVEPHHIEFESENLPSSDSILECCLGLVTLDDSQRFDYHGKVALVHSTLNTFFESYPDILIQIAPDLADTCLTYMLFRPEKQPDILLPLMKSAWVDFLHCSPQVSPQVAGKAWKYCLSLNEVIQSAVIKRGRYPAPALLPTNAAALNGSGDKKKASSTEMSTAGQAMAYPLATPEHNSEERPIPADARRVGQSILHTMCMLGLDCLDAFYDRLKEYGFTSNSEPDQFGVTPLGWTLLSVHHFRGKGPWFTQSLTWDNFENCIRRASQLVELLGFDSGKELWDGTSLQTISTSGSTYTREGKPIYYTSPHPFHFLLANFEAAPDFIKSYLSHVTKSMNLIQWTSLNRDITSDPGEVVDSHLSHFWTMLVLHRSRHLRSFVIPVDRAPDVVAIFEPGSEVPSMVDHCRAGRAFLEYYATRQDVIISKSFTLPGLECTHLKLSSEALLHVAAAGDSLAVFRFALSECGGTVNLKDSKGRTPLHIALGSDALALASRLIARRDIDLNVQDGTGQLPLHICAKRNHLVFTREYLGRPNVKIDHQDAMLRTPLHYAVTSGSRQMVNLFLSKKSDPNIEDVEGKSPLHLAIIQKDVILCEILLEPRPGVSYTASNLRKAWFWATEAGGKFIMALMKTLQTKRQSLLSLDNPGSSSLLSHSWAALQLVLSADQETQFTEKDLDFTLGLSRSATHSEHSEDTSNAFPTTTMALWNGSSLTVANPNETIRDAFVRGAGHAAALLLKRLPVDVNSMGENGESALHLAVIYNAPSAVYCLLQDAGLDTAATDPEDGFTAIELAVNLGRLDILKMLLVSRAIDSIGHIHRSGASCLHLAIKQRFSDAVPLLLECLDVPVNHLDGSGRSALHYAILQDNIKLVEIILDCPRVVAEVPSLDGRTALHFAALSARDSLVSLLLSAGDFDPEHRDSYGKNAHAWAVCNSCRKVAVILREFALRNVQKDTGVADQVMGG